MKTNIIKVGLMASVAASLFMAGSVFAQEANGPRRPDMAAGGPQGRGMRGGPQGDMQGGGMRGGPQGGMRGGPQGDMQGGGMRGGPQGGDSMRMVIRQLDLTDDQKAKIQELMKGNREKTQKQMTDMAALQKKLQAAVEAGDEAAITAAGQELGKAIAEGAKIRMQERKAVEAILTPEQREKATKLRKEMEEKMAAGGPGGMRPPRPEGEEGGDRPPPPEGEPGGDRPPPPEGEPGGDRPPPPEGEPGGDRPPRPEGDAGAQRPQRQKGGNAAGGQRPQRPPME
jgi:translation initiation factor IF-2